MSQRFNEQMTRLFLIAFLVLGGGPADRSELTFPRDHGSHPDAALEWWYYTGHLRDRATREYGFQLTFFRAGDMHLAHFAWTDPARKTFRYEEKSHLGIPGIASAETGRLAVANEDWSAVLSGETHRLHAAGRGWRLDLTLRPSKPPVVHGENGISRKGAGTEEYSRYVSITRLAASGELFRDGRSEQLSGSAWFDHEWGTGALPEDAAGWDWFALQLDDGSDLMLYRIRGRDGRATPFSSGTFVTPDGKPGAITWRDVRLTSTGEWRSPKTRARYPSGWRLEIASLDLQGMIEPLLPDQELITERSTGVNYWEGACRVSATLRGRAVAGRAYAELTGYAGRDLPGAAPGP